MNTSRKILAGTLLVSLITLFGGSYLYADSTDELLDRFTQEIDGIYQDIKEITEIVGDAIEESDLQESALARSFDRIQERADTLGELAEQYDQPWQSEAEKIVEYCDDLNAELEGDEFDEMVAVVLRIPVALNNMEMMFPRYLRDNMDRLAQELNSALAEGDAVWDDLEPVVEKLVLHARQLNFAADVFGKVVWKKFSDPLWELSVELDEKVEEEEEAEIQALLEDMAEPLAMLSKLIK